MTDDSVPDGMRALAKKVTENGGVLTVKMQEVRDAYGSERLGRNVRSGIHDLLDQIGIGHVPKRLPVYQWKPVRLYRRSSPVGKLIRAALNPGENRDETLLKAAGGDAESILRKVRELVCD